jgi:hypothetical protein
MTSPFFNFDAANGVQGEPATPAVLEVHGTRGVIQVGGHNHGDRASTLAGRPPSADRDSVSLPASQTPEQSSAASKTYYKLTTIAQAMRLSKRVVQGLAIKDGWPVRQCGNRFEYLVPAPVEELIVGKPDFKERPEPSTVSFVDLGHNPEQQRVALLREEAVQLVITNLSLGKEIALKVTAEYMCAKYPLFRCSKNSLRTWIERYNVSGLDGLVEQKLGRVGRKPFAAELSTEQILRGRAAAIETGCGGRLNKARAFRDLISDPELSADAKRFMHGNYASKSYVPPSLREAFHSDAHTVALVSIGEHAAELAGPWTECDYANTPAGKAFTCDDMTANVYVWTEWPNEQGFIIVRPQILAAMDIGTTKWISVRAIMRSRGQYTKDDAWGLIGDVFDNYGLYKIAVLEGGIWQSNVFKGHKTGIDDDIRFGGLTSMGVQLIHARTPRAKIIECKFNDLQKAADRCIGYCGRDERHDLPEAVKKAKYDVDLGHAHPSKYFLHFKDYVKHITAVMEQLNNERGDGKVLRGMSPDEKFIADNPQFRVMPDTAKYLYRSSYSIVLATANGVRVTIGSGKYIVSYTYSAPELKEVRGRRVVVYWNDGNPDTDAVVYTVRNGQPDQFICVAPRLIPLDRFESTMKEMDSEKQRKAMIHQMSVAESKSFAAHLQRREQTITVATPQTDLGQRLAAARSEREVKERVAAQTASAVRKIEVTPEMIRAITAPTTEDSRPGEVLSNADLSRVLSANND